MPYQWLFIDADDTLFDYSQAETHALERSFSDFHLPYSDDALLAYQKYNLQSWHELEQGLINAEKLRVIRFERLFNHLEIQSDPESFSRRYLVHLAEGFFLIDGVVDLIPKLAARYRLGLITNGLPEVQRPRLVGAGLAPFFQFVTISEEIGLAKPDPRFFATALAQAGGPDPRSVLVIGDSLSSDIRGGFQSGLDTLWYNPSAKPADPRWPATYEAADLYTIERLLL
jgi:2-haloacid dehalogenase